MAFRSLLTMGLVLLVVWGAMYWCTKDVLVWGLIFLVQNVSQLIFAIYRQRNIKFPSDLEDLYREVNCFNSICFFSLEILD